MDRFMVGGGLLAAFVAGACGSDHDLLANHPAGEMGPADASLDVRDEAALADEGRADAGLDVADAEASSDGPSGPTEPAGPRTITLLNGIEDAEAARICLVPIRGGVEMPLEAAPLPPASLLLSFGRRWSGDTLAGFDPATTDLRIYLVAGDATVVAAGTCPAFLQPSDGGDATTDAAVAADALADVPGEDATPPPSRVRVLSLPEVPAGTLADERSYLFVVSGCVGGPGHDDPAGEAICGDGYSAETPTASLSVVALSRITAPGSLALQVMHESPPTPDVHVTVAPSGGLSAWTLSDDLMPGALGPRPPSLAHGLASLGVSPLDALIDVQAAATASHSGARTVVPISDALSLSGMTLADLKDGHAYTLVLLGAAPTVAITQLGKPFGIAIVPNDKAP